MAASVNAPVVQLLVRERRQVVIDPVTFADLDGFECDDHLEAFGVFKLSCAAIAAKSPSLRKAMDASASLEAIAHEALRFSPRGGTEAKQFFETHFTPCRLSADCVEEHKNGFLTGYFEPIVDGSLTKTGEFTAPSSAGRITLMQSRPISTVQQSSLRPVAAVPHPSFSCETA
jgi:membrane-bound lytic murein transglycosylase